MSPGRSTAPFVTLGLLISGCIGAPAPSNLVIDEVRIDYDCTRGIIAEVTFNGTNAGNTTLLALNGTVRFERDGAFEASGQMVPRLAPEETTRFKGLIAGSSWCEETGPITMTLELEARDHPARIVTYMLDPRTGQIV